jgi:hypothetical protein
MSDERKPSGFWSTFPGLLTGMAALISAVAGLMVAMRQAPPPASPVSANASLTTAGNATPHPAPPVRPGVKPLVLLSSMGGLQDNLAFVHSDIESDGRHASSAAVCSLDCQFNPRCRAMTFIKSQQTCWLKDSVPSTAASSDMVSAVKLMGPLEDGVDYPGGDLSSNYTPSVAECYNACTKNLFCRGISYTKSTGVCWTKSSIPNRVLRANSISAAKLVN